MSPQEKRPSGAKARPLVGSVVARLKPCPSQNMPLPGGCGATTSHSRQLHPRHPAREAGLAHLLEHLLHLRVLAEQIIHFLHSCA
jgi:hypothetical protein